MTSQIGWNLAENDISLIHEISDDMAFRIITSISDSAKAATRISIENKILRVLLIRRLKNYKNLELSEYTDLKWMEPVRKFYYTEVI